MKSDQLFSLVNKNRSVVYLSVILFYLTTLFSTYPNKAGFITDEMAFLNVCDGYDNYIDFQKDFSNKMHMVARPVSAVVHGFSYWTFRDHFMYYHILNLLIFSLGTIVFYFLCRNLFNHSFAFLATVISISYPLASATTFSSIIVNANVACLLCMLSLNIAAKKEPDKISLLACFLMILSLLSYEAFFAYIPLFLFIRIIKNDNKISKDILRYFVIEVFLILIPIVFYRKFLQFKIFTNKLDKLQRLQVRTMFERAVYSIYYNIKSHTIDFWQLISNAFAKNGPYLFVLTLICVVIVLLVFVYGNKANDYKKSFSFKKILILFVFIVLCFLAYQLVYISSWNYYPNIHGYESRILVNYRYLYGLLLTGLFFLLVYKFNKIQNVLLPVIAVILFINTYCVFAQKEAFSGAYSYSEYHIKKISEIIKQDGLYTKDSLSIVAYMPAQFPEQVNKEEILTYSWDFSPPIQKQFKSVKIFAWSADPERLLFTKSGISVPVFSASNFPFYLYNYKTQNISFVSNKEEFLKAVE